MVCVIRSFRGTEMALLFSVLARCGCLLVEIVDYH